jgi:hypothetical protein
MTSSTPTEWFFTEDMIEGRWCVVDHEGFIIARDMGKSVAVEIVAGKRARNAERTKAKANFEARAMRTLKKQTIENLSLFVS